MKRKTIILLSSLLLSSFIAVKYSRAVIDSENFALGVTTTSHFAKENGYPIHIDRISEVNIKGLEQRCNKVICDSITLILGNSQTHSINQVKDGEHTFVHALNKRESIQPVICHSVPNASMQNFLLSAAYLTSKFKVKQLVLPVFFDDYREDGIRDVFYPKIVDDQYLIDTSYGSCVDLINEELKSYWKEDVQNEKRYVSSQQKSEAFLDSSLTSMSTIWSARPNMRAQLFVNLYYTRNKIFNISAQTIRHKIPSRYDKNMDCLKAILTLAETNNITVYLYIPPIRNDVQIPYDLNDYQLFKVEIEALCNTYSNCYYKNLEDLVPAEYFGMKKSTSGSSELEYDFMHFQFKGHQLLDSALNDFILSHE